MDTNTTSVAVAPNDEQEERAMFTFPKPGTPEFETLIRAGSYFRTGISGESAFLPEHGTYSVRIAGVDQLAAGFISALIPTYPQETPAKLAAIAYGYAEALLLESASRAQHLVPEARKVMEQLAEEHRVAQKALREDVGDTTQVPPAPTGETADEIPAGLIRQGSLFFQSDLGAVVTVGGVEKSLGEVVSEVHAQSGLTVEAWNALSNEQRDLMLTAYLASQQEAATAVTEPNADHHQG